MSNVKTNTTKLEDAKKEIEALNYRVELAATHLDVYLPLNNSKMSEGEMAIVEAKLKAQFEVDIWLMKEDVIS